MRWDEDEVRRLRTYFDAGMDANSFTAEFAERSKSSIVHKLSCLGLHFPGRTKDKSKYGQVRFGWSEEDILELRRCVKDGVDLNSIAMKFPKHPPNSIARKLKSLGLPYRRVPAESRSVEYRLWSSSEDAQVLAYADNYRAQEKSVGTSLNYASLAAKLQRTPQAVDSRMKRLEQQIRFAPNSGKSWTEEDLRLLLTWHVEGEKYKVIGKRLGRTVMSIAKKLADISDK